MVTKERVPKSIEKGRRERFGGPRKEAVIAVVRAADRLRRRFTTVLEPHGLTVQQYNVLRILRGALPDPLPTMEVAERMMEKAPAITGLLDRLESKRLVARARQSNDRRCVRCSITRAGLELLTALDGPIDHADAEAFARLDDGEIGRLTRLLARVAEE
jgi:MarR family transcriptional regulator, organic hydroperoxide resistance regulator